MKEEIKKRKRIQKREGKREEKKRLGKKAVCIHHGPVEKKDGKYKLRNWRQFDKVIFKYEQGIWKQKGFSVPWTW